MPYKRTVAVAAVAAMLAGSAAAQVGGGSISGSGTIGGSGSVGGTTLGGSGTVSPGNQSPAPGNPVLPNTTRSNPGASGQPVRTPGNTSLTETQQGLSNNTIGVDNGITASTPTPPQSIIDQPNPPPIPLPGEAGADPATIDLQQDQLPTR